MKENQNSKRRWQIYHGAPNGRSAEGPRVTLNYRKVFLLNPAAVEVLGTPGAVELRYDEDTRTIGLAPQDPHVSNAFPLRLRNAPKYAYRTIHAAPYCKQFDINPKGTLLFTNVDLDNEGTMLLELKTAVAVGRGFR
jgi:hypothetical protein